MNCVIVVRPGKTVKIKVKFTEPRNLPNDFGVYSGYISIKDSAYETVSTIPYLGVKGDLKNKLLVIIKTISLKHQIRMLFLLDKIN